MAMITSVTIDCRRISDWATFHDVFADTLGFFEGYGRNGDAWIDCMSCLDDEVGLSAFRVPKAELVLLKLNHADQLKRVAPQILSALFELVGFVNFRRLNAGEPPLLIISACP